MNVRKRLSAIALTVAMIGGAFGLGGPAVAAPASPQALPPNLPGGIPKGHNHLGDRLLPGQSMDENHDLISKNGQHRLAADGWISNEVGLYLTSYSTTPHVISVTNSSADVDNKLIMQGDGNLVLYTNGVPTWHTRTFNNPGSFAVIQDDRNVVVYSPQGKPLYASKTLATDAYSFNVLGRTWTSQLQPGWYLQSSNSAYKLLMQGDGNLVLYTRAGKAVWSSRTQGNPGARFVVQPDGNMVIYTTQGKPVWNSRTMRAGDGNTFGLVVQPDGNLVEYLNPVSLGYPVPTVLWQSGTAGSR